MAVLMLLVAASAFPVIPWPKPSATSPVPWTPWLVNWDISYRDNSTDLEAALELSDPDIFEWDFGTENNRQHELTRRGIAVSSHQSYEWQQSSGAPDANPFFRRNFARNGVGLDESGVPEPLHPDRGNLSDFMSQLAPKWHALTKEGDVRAAAYGQSVTQDNVGNYYGVFQGGGPILPQDSGFSWGPWINSGFVAYYTALQNRSSDLPPLPNGTEFVAFRYVAALRRRGLNPLQLTRDAVLHEYVRYTQNATVARWVDMRHAAQRQARKSGTQYPLAVYGNLECLAFHPDACGWQQNRMGIMAAQHVDVILLEALLTNNEFKVAVAAGNFEKPVFPYPDTCPDPCEGPTATARAMGAAPASTTSHAKWYGEQRQLFTDRRPVADYAVMLDLPLFFWRGFSSLAVPGDSPHVLAMQNITGLFDEEHVTYDVLFHGAAGFYDDAEHWARLTSYRTLVLALVESVSDEAVARVQHFLSQGGRVVLLGDACGSTDEEDRPRETGAFEPLRHAPNVTWVSQDVLDAFTSNQTGPARQIVERALAIHDAPLLTTNLSSGVTATVWQHGNGPMISVQLANGDKHPDATLSSPHALSIRLGGELARRSARGTALEVLFYSWSLPQNGTAPLPLAFTQDGSDLTVVVPPFERFGAVTVGVTGEASVRHAAGHVRKLFERLTLASTSAPGARADARANAAASAALATARALLAKVQGAGSRILDRDAIDNLNLRFHASNATLSAALQRAGADVVAYHASARAAATNTSAAIASIGFGRTSMLGGAAAPPGWRQVDADTVYTHESGVGWVSGGTEPARLRVQRGPAPGALRQGKKVVAALACPFPEHGVLCTYLFGNSTERSTLRLALPRAGNFTVEVVMGEPSAMVTRVGITGVWDGDGEAASLLGVGARLPGPGEYATLAFPVIVPPPTSADAPPLLELSFGGMAATPFFQFDDRNNGTAFFTMAWMLNALLVRDAGARASSAAAARSLRGHAVVAGGVREWMVIGPLDDSDATCMVRRTEAEAQLNMSATYARKAGGVVAWQRVSLQTPLAHLDFAQHGVRDSDGLGALALAVTHLWLPGAQSEEVVLTGSLTGVGVGFVGSAEVLRDELNAGLLLDEERVQVRLHPGWNTVLLRSCTQWQAQGWGLWLALELPDGSRADHVRADACGALC
eukprot:g1842.t1